MLADRFIDASSEGATNQAANDRTWKFGHVIVDEAQEISPMAWRMIFRRNPNRSMTIVGDLAQSGAPWAPDQWGSILDKYAKDNWRLTELTVNYRTPSEIMELAEPVLAIAAPGIKAPAAIRDSGYVPRRYSALRYGIANATAAVVAHELQSLAEGRLAVLAPETLVGELGAALEERLPEWFTGTGRADDDRVVLLGVREAKGLEFDAVVVVEPGLIVNASPRGRSDLYVALTRATQRLALVHQSPLPPELDRLSDDILSPAPVPE
jgi:superfamily I DNA/RNA helicase